MGPLLQAELIKLRTTRTFVALIGVTVVLSLAAVVLQAIFIDAEPGEELSVFNADFTGFFILILAIVGISGEWRHRTITSSLLAAPLRWRFLLAKVIAYAVTGLVVSLLVTLATTAVGLLVLTLRDMPLPDLADFFDLGWRNLLLAAIFGAFGVGLGGLIRNQPVAIVVVLVDGFIVEFLLLGLVPEVGRFGPLTALSAGVLRVEGENQAADLADLFGFWASLGLLGVWIALLVGAAGLLLQKRDVDSS